MIPLILSASRATDIPAFYGDWFMDRLDRGWLQWINPFNGRTRRVELHRVKAVVFWTKDPSRFFKHLDALDRRIPAYYFLFTLNDYEPEDLEPAVPPLNHRIEMFQRLSDRLGRHRVIWRSDPLLLTETLDADTLLARIRFIGDRIHRYTDRQVFSFARIREYAKVRRNLDRCGIPWRDIAPAERNRMVRSLAEMATGWSIRLSACAEDNVAAWPGVEPGRCVDDALIVSINPDPELLRFYRWERTPSGLQRSGLPRIDPGQRQLCRCVVSKDIGRYNTCRHLCRYCYANTATDPDALGSLNGPPGN